MSDFPISPTRFQLNFFSKAIRALLHATCDGIVRKNKGYSAFFDSVGVVEPNDNWKDERVLSQVKLARSRIFASLCQALE